MQDTTQRDGKDRMRTLKRGVAIASLLAAICVGCESADSPYNATVQGTVTIDGEMATRGSVTFHPVDNGPTAYATIQKDGSYALRTGQGPIGEVDGGQVHSGDYIVTVVVTETPAAKDQIEDSGPPIPGPRITAARYARKKSSDLRFKVDPGANVISLELERALEDEADEMTEEEEEDEASAVEAEEGAEVASEADESAAPGEQPSTSSDSTEEADEAPPVEVETPTQQSAEEAKP
jgi:hypothetical protein